MTNVVICELCFSLMTSSILGRVENPFQKAAFCKQIPLSRKAGFKSGYWPKIGSNRVRLADPSLGFTERGFSGWVVGNMGVVFEDAQCRWTKR